VSAGGDSSGRRPRGQTAERGCRRRRREPAGTRIGRVVAAARARTAPGRPL